MDWAKRGVCSAPRTSDQMSCEHYMPVRGRCGATAYCAWGKKGQACEFKGRRGDGS